MSKDENKKQELSRQQGDTGETTPRPDDEQTPVESAALPDCDAQDASSGKTAKSTRTKKPLKPIAKWLIVGAAALVVAGVVFAALWANNIFNRPETLFNSTLTATATPAPTPTPRKTLGPDAEDGEEPNSGHTIDEMEQLADTSTMKNIVNVLLVGVDYASERDNNKSEYVNKNFNSDVMMLLAMNFDEKKVDMISVPRDTYAKIANAEGKYKLNFSLTLGGGINNDGFMNVCKSVEWVIGGIPVDYYIGVTMPVVKELTDAIGGIDFYVDVPITIQGRTMEVGYQHLDGQQVLDYCRARKNMEDSGDLNRVNRQKKMLLAVFEKLQRSTQIFDVPELLLSMQGKVYTNLNLNQLAAMAVFGKKLDSANITMRTMGGSYANIFGFGYVCTDQKKRVEIVKDVYGVNVAQRPEYELNYAKLEWAAFVTEKYVERIEPILKKDAARGDTRLIPAETAAALETQLASTKTLLKKAEGILESKKGATQAVANEMIACRESIETNFQAAFKAAGYNMDWKVSAYEDGQVKMKE
ncbi:MAG: LCP family protein [Eubacteriales bacterium]|nr:LCP family protein [Eubacteriales bacterium]